MIACNTSTWGKKADQEGKPASASHIALKKKNHYYFCIKHYKNLAQLRMKIKSCHCTKKKF